LILPALQASVPVVLRVQLRVLPLVREQVPVLVQLRVLARDCREREYRHQESPCQTCHHLRQQELKLPLTEVLLLIRALLCLL